jgi:hypothetical protein
LCAVPAPPDAADITRVMGHADVYGNLLQLPLPSEELWRSRIEAMGSPRPQPTC